MGRSHSVLVNATGRIAAMPDFEVWVDLWSVPRFDGGGQIVAEKVGANGRKQKQSPWVGSDWLSLLAPK